MISFAKSMFFLVVLYFPIWLEFKDSKNKHYKVLFSLMTILFLIGVLDACVGLESCLNLRYDTAIIDSTHTEPSITLYNKGETRTLDANDYKAKYFECLYAWYGMSKEDAISAYKEIGADIKDNGERKEFSYSGQLYALDINNGKIMLYYDEFEIIRKIVIKK